MSLERKIKKVDAKLKLLKIKLAKKKEKDQEKKPIRKIITK